jgi:predicted metal-binding membrane protein
MATSAPSPGRAEAGRLDAASLWAALLAAAAICWALTVRSWDEMGNGPGPMGRALPGFLAFWVVMMAAMMLPSVAPVAQLYARTIRTGSTGAARVARTGALVGGYLAAWAAFGVLVYLALVGAERLLESSPDAGPWIAAAILAVCGAYQLTPLKDRCLSHCRSPLGLLLHFGGYRGRLRDLRVGLYHGGYCVGCCWSLMAVFVAFGVMNIAWMAGLAALILLEKSWKYGRGLGRLFGVALIVLAFFVPWNPGLVPGLAVDEEMPAMQVDGDAPPTMEEESPPTMEGETVDDGMEMGG